MKVLSVSKLSKEEKERLLLVFDSVSKQDFPSIWIQLARNLHEDRIDKSKLKEYSLHFEGINEHFGKGFIPRLEIDKVIMEAIGIDKESQEKMLEEIYLYLLDEIFVLDNIIEGEEE